MSASDPKKTMEWKRFHISVSCDTSRPTQSVTVSSHYCPCGDQSQSKGQLNGTHGHAKITAITQSRHQNAIQSSSSPYTVWRASSWLAITGSSEEALLWWHEGYIEKVPHTNRPPGNSCSRHVHMARHLQGRPRCIHFMTEFNQP